MRDCKSGTVSNWRLLSLIDDISMRDLLLLLLARSLDTLSPSCYSCLLSMLETRAKGKMLGLTESAFTMKAVRMFLFGF